jgi:hypothetical protein
MLRATGSPLTKPNRIALPERVEQARCRNVQEDALLAKFPVQP